MKRLLLETKNNQIWIALVHDGQLIELVIDENENSAIIGNIYAGRVENILAGLGAAFINIGVSKNAFLPIEQTDNKNNKIRIGDEIVVQVIKEQSRSKGPMVTTNITFTGKYTVLLTKEEVVRISAKLKNESERARLTEIANLLDLEDTGIIMRTESEGKSYTEIKTETDRLIAQYKKYKEAAPYIKAPSLIYEELSVMTKVVREMLTEEIDEFIVEGEEAFNLIKEAAIQISPHYENKIHEYKGEIPLFKNYFIETQINKALQKKVWLKSGGFITIEQTEACVVIDVNTGNFLGKKDISETITTANKEAALEIAKQIRLRNLSGMIIIDFIDMKTNEQKNEVQQVLKAAVHKDRIKTSVIGMTELGLMQLTRKKTTKPISDVLMKDCKVCSGTGKSMYTTLGRQLTL